MFSVRDVTDDLEYEYPGTSLKRRSLRQDLVTSTNPLSPDAFHNQRHVTFGADIGRAFERDKINDIIAFRQEDMSTGSQAMRRPSRVYCDKSDTDTDTDINDFDIEDPSSEYDTDTPADSHSQTHSTSFTDNGAPTSGIPQRNLFNIIKSRYMNQENNEDVGIEVTCGQDSGPKRQQRGNNAFRWVHLRNDVMDFEQFISSSLQTPGLSSTEKSIMKDKLSELQRQHEKQIWTQLTPEGQRMGPFVFQKLWLHGSAARSELNRKIVIMSFPVFLLDKFNEHIQLASPTNHVPLTLLQHLSRTIPLEQDTRQAVCSIPMGRKDSCFYIHYMWCLILNDDLIITCSKLSEDDLTGGTINVSREPTSGSPYIRVTDGGNCTWQLDPNDCQSWFEFTANFMKISSSYSSSACAFEHIFCVMMRGREVTAENWARSVIVETKETTVHLVLVRRTHTKEQASGSNMTADNASIKSEGIELSSSQMEQQPLLPGPSYKPTELDPSEFPPDEVAAVYERFDVLHGIARPQYDAGPVQEQRFVAESSTHGNNVHSGGTTETNNIPVVIPIELPEHHEFHALQSIVRKDSRHTNESTVDMQRVTTEKQELAELLEEVDAKVRLNRNGDLRDSYRRCQQKTLPEVVKRMLVVTLTADALSSPESFFTAAIQVFGFFLPLQNDSKIAEKYWGSIHYIMKKCLMVPIISPVTLELIENFKELSKLALVITNEMASPGGPPPGSIEIPKKWEEAFEHCVSFLLLLCRRSKEARWHIERLEKCLRQGRELLWRSAMKKPLRDKEVASPLALVSVIIKNMIVGSRWETTRPDIAEVYLEYFRRLESDIKSGRLKRLGSELINLREEIRAVFLGLDFQRDTLKTLSRKIDEQSVGWSFLHSRRRGQASRTETLVIQQCIEYVEGQTNLIAFVSKDLKKLEIWVQKRNESTKDMHENAIYALTVVTVVFLPLSFVCSFLGMNTAGIRDTEHGQGIFWIIALPLTFIVIMFALFWTEQLRNTWKAISSWLRNCASGFAVGSRYHSPSQRLRDAQLKTKDGTMKTRDLRGNVVMPALPTVEQPPPMDPWERPYRRTETFKSVI